MKPRWTDKLARAVKDTDGAIIRTRKEARDYMAALPDKRALRSQWQIAARFLLDGVDVEPLTRAIELALMYEARLDVRHANAQASSKA